VNLTHVINNQVILLMALKSGPPTVVTIRLLCFSVLTMSSCLDLAPHTIGLLIRPPHPLVVYTLRQLAGVSTPACYGLAMRIATHSAAPISSPRSLPPPPPPPIYVVRNLQDTRLSMSVRPDPSTVLT
jgi:hypothetical protein